MVLELGLGGMIGVGKGFMDWSTVFLHYLPFEAFFLKRVMIMCTRFTSLYCLSFLSYIDPLLAVRAIQMHTANFMRFSNATKLSTRFLNVTQR